MISNVIAIDGPAASGKSSISNMLAERLGIPFVSTGALYRAVAWKALQNGLDPAAPNMVKLEQLLAQTAFSYEKLPNGNEYQVKVDAEFPGEALRTPEVALGASSVAKLPVVRDYLLKLQRSFSEKFPLFVMEGRDIGSVIFPDAKYKFFLTASPRVRAVRRLTQEGREFTEEEIVKVAAEIEKRDLQDSTREVAPLKQMPDAILIDNSDYNFQETLLLFLRELDKEDGGIGHTVLRYRIPYADTDAMGVVYYANYLRYFEMFRTEFMVEAGFSYGEMEKSGVALPVIEAHCTYKSSARFEDVIEITGGITESNGVRIRIDCSITCNGKLLVKGYTVHACMDMKTKRPVRVPKYLQILEKKGEKK